MQIRSADPATPSLIPMRFTHPCGLHVGSVFTVAGHYVPLPWWRRWLAAVGVKQPRRLQVFEVKEMSHGGRRIVTEKIGVSMPTRMKGAGR